MKCVLCVSVVKPAAEYMLCVSCLQTAQSNSLVPPPQRRPKRAKPKRLPHRQARIVPLTTDELIEQMEIRYHGSGYCN